MFSLPAPGREGLSNLALKAGHRIRSFIAALDRAWISCLITKRVARFPTHLSYFCWLFLEQTRLLDNSFRQTPRHSVRRLSPAHVTSLFVCAFLRKLIRENKFVSVNFNCASRSYVVLDYVTIRVCLYKAEPLALASHVR